MCNIPIYVNYFQSILADIILILFETHPVQMTSHKQYMLPVYVYVCSAGDNGTSV